MPRVYYFLTSASTGLAEDLWLQSERCAAGLFAQPAGAGTRWHLQGFLSLTDLFRYNNGDTCKHEVKSGGS